MNNGQSPSAPPAQRGAVGGVAAVPRQSSRPPSQMIRKPPQGLFCQYSKRSCHQNRLDGFDFCLKHILEDKNAPYRQCNYVSLQIGKRCTNPAPKVEKQRGEGFCFDHARKAKWSRRARSRTKRSNEDASVSILSRLSDRYLGDSILRGFKPASKSSAAPNEFPAAPPIPKNWAGAESAAAKALEAESDDADSDAEFEVMEAAWRGDAESDAESVDSDLEDQLKFAETYTTEEVALVTREKLIRLQTLYIEQFKRLQHVMREKRRKLLATRVTEKTKYGSIYGAKNDLKESKRMERYRAFKRYHKRSGKEGLLQQRLDERRSRVSEGLNYQPPSYPKCLALVQDRVLGTGNEPVRTVERQCGEKAIPLAKYCPKHILLDSQQNLFVPCGCASRDGGAGSSNAMPRCPVPVANVVPSPACAIHKTVEPQSSADLLAVLKRELARRKNFKTEEAGCSSTAEPPKQEAKPEAAPEAMPEAKTETEAKPEVSPKSEQFKDFSRDAEFLVKKEQSVGEKREGEQNGPREPEVSETAMTGEEAGEEPPHSQQNGENEASEDAVNSLPGQVAPVTSLEAALSGTDVSASASSTNASVGASQSAASVSTCDNGSIPSSASQTEEAMEGVDDDDALAVDNGTQTTMMSLSFQSSNGTDDSYASLNDTNEGV